jgi:hypothetical protein
VGKFKCVLRKFERNTKLWPISSNLTGKGLSVQWGHIRADGGYGGRMLIVGCVVCSVCIV